MRVAVFKGQSQYDVLRFFSEKIAMGFTQLGCEVDIIDLLCEDWQTHLISSVRKGLNAVIAPNGVACDLKNAEGNSFFDTNGIRYIGLFVDHPSFHLNRIMSAPKNSIFTFIDKSHLDFAKTYLNKYGTIHYFLPHGGSLTDNARLERKKNFLFSGSFKSITLDDVRLKNYPFLLSSLLTNTYEEMVSEPHTNFHQVFENVLQHSNIYFAQEHIRLKIMSKIFIDINLIRCSSNRINMLNAFENNGLKVDICGPSSWEEYCSDKRFMNYRGQKSYREILQLYSQYKFVLNDNNDFFSGSHERHFDALQNGACPISPINEYYSSGAHACGIGMFYDRYNIDESIAELVDTDTNYEAFQDGLKLFSDEQRLQQSWLYRVAELINLLELE